MRRRRAAATLAPLVALLAPTLGCGAFGAASEGERLYRRLCADCHGVDARGNTARSMGNPWADLTDDAWKHAGGDSGSIESVVREGVFGEMPAQENLSADEMRALVGHLMSLRGESL